MFFFIAAATFIADQVSKAAVRVLMYQGESIPVAPPVFYITYIMNPGAAFGLLANRTPFFIAVGILLVAGVLIGYKKLPKGNNLLKYGLALLLGGALGNLADRLRYGRVVDFLDFRVWPVFNLADIAIVAGVCLLAWELIKGSGNKSKRDRGL
ncbi:MAG: signal peptidase II [Desulfotomaculaceae bacterium]|nr:signal peptidase II [Desulfotomaculaceae bacterium]